MSRNRALDALALLLLVLAGVLPVLAPDSLAAVVVGMGLALAALVVIVWPRSPRPPAVPA